MGMEEKKNHSNDPTETQPIDEQGRYVVIDKDENGYNIVAYATDGSEQYLYVTDDALDDTNGVDLYF